MHSVPRSPEPGFFVEIRSAYNDWTDLEGPDRQRIRQELKHDFNGVCVYCEQQCLPTSQARGSKYEESVDHYKPRHRCRSLWLDWLNLVYACRRCNQKKDDKWPELGDDANKSLEALYPQYTEVSEYLGPNEVADQRSARECIDYNRTTGDIIPNDSIGSVGWSIAKRTIVDIDLNDVDLGQYDNSRLPTRRLVRLGLLARNINQLDSMDEKIAVIRSFAQADKPFSTFIYTWVSNRFPWVL